MSTNQSLHIVLSSNERYMPGATVALASLAVNAKSETSLHFHVFTENVKRETFAFLEQTILRLHPASVVEEHVCDETILADLPEYAGSRMAWVRCFYARILSNVNWVLYIDCDVLYLASVEEHFTYKDDDVYACVVKDMSLAAMQEDQEWARLKCGVELDTASYFNSGVMLLNLEKLRDDDVPEKIADFIKQHPDAKYADQTAMNVLFNGKDIKLIPERFNWLQLYLDDAALLRRPVIHYVCGVPWLPRLGAVANGRFMLWHAFADKYIWMENGRSSRNLFSRRQLALKRICFHLLRLPVIGLLFACLLKCLGRINNARGWCWSQVSHDCSRRGIAEVLNG